MTAAPHSPLVEKVATAIATRRAQSQVPRRLFHIEYAAPTPEDTRDAQAAIAACHAQEMLAVLRRVAEWADGGDTLNGCFTEVRALLAKLDGRS